MSSIKTPLLPESIIALPDLPPFKWGFTTRLGGVSQPPYKGFNLADHVGDNPDFVNQNRTALASHLAGDGKKLNWFSLRQIHGTKVVRAPFSASPPPEGDILIATAPGCLLAILVADCVPIILADAVAGIYGVAHCGWRGLTAHGILEAVKVFKNFGSKAENIHAAIGPAIGPCCFETGTDVYRQIKNSFPENYSAAFKKNIDLKLLAFYELQACGIPSNSITTLNYCTKCNTSLFFSYRGEKITGRFAGFIACPPS